MSDERPAPAGPEWMERFRRRGGEIAASIPPPEPEEEQWRYSPIAALDFGSLDAYESHHPELTGATSIKAFPERDGLIVCSDDQIVSAELSGDALAAGVVAGRLVDHLDAEAIATDLPEPDDHLSGLNQATSAQPIVIDVPAGAVLAKPLVIASRAGAGTGVSFPRLIVRVGQDAEVTVVDHQRGGRDRLVVPVTNIAVGRATRVRYLAYQDMECTAWQLARLIVTADASSEVGLFTMAAGAGYGRLRADCDLIGSGAHARLAAAYVSGGEQVHDFRTFQRHVAPDTSSDLLFKGVVDDAAQAIYTGLIHVGPDARGVNALQTNRTITLSEEASAESVPNLEIENNEVQCSHASAVGPIDQEQRFYLEARGVPSARAERLIIEGFIDEVVSELPAGQEAIRAAVAERFARSDGDD